MANRLTKSTQTVYQPAVPAIPGQPARCITVVSQERDAFGFVKDAGRASSSSGSSGGSTRRPPGNIVDGSLGEVNPSYTDAARMIAIDQGIASYAAGDRRTPQEQVVCYPAVAGQPGSPARTITQGFNGWNGGARSIEVLLGDGYVEFEFPPKPLGVIAGLSGADRGPVFNDCEHAFYASGTQIFVVESGQVKATASVSPSSGLKYRITRRAGVVTYTVDSWSYQSGLSSQGAKTLDAAIYASGGYVDNPVMVSIPPGGYVDARAPLPRTAITEAEYAFVEGWALRPSVAISGRQLNSLQVVAPRPGVVMADRPYASASGRAPVPVVVIEGGFPVPQFASVDVGLPPPVVGIYGLTGGIGGVSVQAPRPAYLMADRPYAEVRATAPVPRGVMYAPVGNPLDWAGAEALFTVDYLFTDPVFYIEFREQIGLQPTLVVVELLDDVLIESLMLGDNFTLSELIEALIRDGIAVSNNLASNPTAALQMAVNLLTGAATAYSNYDFLAFARADGFTYGVKADGLYRIGGDQDDGAMISSLLDLGVTDLGTAVSKNVDTAYLGLRTDGTVTLTVCADNEPPYTYVVEDRGDIARAEIGRGLYGREWRFTLAVDNATHTDLDSIEFVTSVAVNRWNRRG